MAITFDEAVAQVTGPGQFEIGDAIVNGSLQRVFVNAQRDSALTLQSPSNRNASGISNDASTTCRPSANPA